MAVKVHELKIWPPYYEAVAVGEKTFEVRKNDRDFQPGDRLHLREWDPNNKTYTGREIARSITYVMRGPAFGIEPDHCVMAIT